ncbi:MAG: AmmeMemoRadiSam system radical SAM enzyme [Desulfovibrio sp.]|nr:AmmeMemoRadiSam system radical SAM enzyme [Desulfovibrio sp.]
MLPTLLWSNTEGLTIRCSLCSHECLIKNGNKGICKARINKDGQLVSVLTDVVSSIQMDPVEKKPLFHFLPGTKTFSVGSVGCNFHCTFCQNNHISNIPQTGVINGRKANARTLLDLAQKQNAKSIAFTYNEPTLSVELIQETAERAKAYQLPVILVSNGYMSRACIDLLRHSIHAINVDIKSFSDAFYREYCGAKLAPVLDAVQYIRDCGWWLEITTLVIPSVNDSPEELKQCARFIHDVLGPDVPWHVTAFHGAHKMANHPSTTSDQLQTAWRIGKEAGLNYVYMGNLASPVGGNTYCPSCKALVVERTPWKILFPPHGHCPKCGTPIPGVWR